MSTNDKLTSIGFKKVYPDNIDKDYFFFQLNIKHKMLYKPHVIIDSNTIALYCKETNKKINGRSAVISSKYDVCLYYDVFTIDNVTSLLKWLNGN